jgi:hypothetical protein
MVRERCLVLIGIEIDLGALSCWNCVGEEALGGISDVRTNVYGPTMTLACGTGQIGFAYFAALFIMMRIARLWG